MRRSTGDLMARPWTSLGTQLSWHSWELLIHRIHPEPLQLQREMSELGFQVGRSWLSHPLARSAARARRSKGAALSGFLSFPWPVPDLALPLCCDCRPQARRDWSRPPGRKGRIPHRDRYAPTPQRQGGNWHGHGSGARTVPAWRDGSWALPGFCGEQHLPQERGTDAGRSALSPGSLRGGGAEVGMGSGPRWLSACVPPQGSEHRRRRRRQQPNLVSRPLWHPFPSRELLPLSLAPCQPRGCWLYPRVPADRAVPAAGAGVLPGVGGIPGVAPGVGIGGVPGVGGEAMRGLCPGVWGGSPSLIPSP